MKYRKILTLVLLGGLWAASAVVAARGQTRPDDEAIRVETTLVTVPVIVSDRRNRYIAGLKAADFSVFKDDEPQRIEFFAAEESPLSVAVLLDTSRSTERVLERIQDAAVEFVRRLKPADRAMIVSFDSEVNVLSELTNDRRRLEKTIRRAAIGERFGTVLQDALAEVVTRRFRDVRGRKAVILLTDGKDFGSRTTRAELLFRLEESDTLVYPVFYETGFGQRRRRPLFERPGGVFGGRRGPRAARANEEAREFLGEIAELTAGRFYGGAVDDLPATFEAIAEELRRQYLIGFYPEKIEPGKVYRLRVRVARSDAAVRAKTTFRVRENGN